MGFLHRLSLTINILILEFITLAVAPIFRNPTLKFVFRRLHGSQIFLWACHLPVSIFGGIIMVSSNQMYAPDMYFSMAEKASLGGQKLHKWTSTQNQALIMGYFPSHCPLDSCVLMRSIQRSSGIPSQESMQNILRVMAQHLLGRKQGSCPNIPSAAHRPKYMLLSTSLSMHHLRFVPQQSY